VPRHNGLRTWTARSVSRYVLCRLQVQRFALCCTRLHPFHCVLGHQLAGQAVTLGVAGFLQVHKEEGYARRQLLFACVILCVAILLGVATAVAQVNTATLTGLVTDPQGLTVRGAKVTATSLATGAERTATADEGGRYTIVGLVPGEYKLRVEGSTNSRLRKPSVQVTVGQEAILNVKAGTWHADPDRDG